MADHALTVEIGDDEAETEAARAVIGRILDAPHLLDRRGPEQRPAMIEHCDGEAAEIVIIDSTLKFLRPVRETIVAECVPPDAAAVEHFIDRYRQRGKARWSVEVIVRADGEPAMTFKGHYGVFAG